MEILQDCSSQRLRCGLATSINTINIYSTLNNIECTCIGDFDSSLSTCPFQPNFRTRSSSANHLTSSKIINLAVVLDELSQCQQFYDMVLPELAPSLQEHVMDPQGTAQAGDFIGGRMLSALWQEDAVRGRIQPPAVVRQSRLRVR